jgi:hypothetical protein
MGASFRISHCLPLLFAVLLSGCSCANEPPADGELFECSVDGRFWQAKVEGIDFAGGGDPVKTWVSPTADGFVLNVFARLKASDKNEAFSFDFLPISGDPPVISLSDSDIFAVTFSNGFFLDSNLSSSITLSVFDTAAQRIEGTFNLNLVNSKGESLEVSDGRFKLNFDNG